MARGSARSERGFDTVVQELVPDSESQIWSLFAYLGRSGRPLATVTGVKVRQGPLHFGTSAVFRTTPQPRVRELGLRLLESAGYKGFAQVEFAYDRRDGDYKLLEVNTRVPMWAGVAMTPPLRHGADRVRRPAAAARSRSRSTCSTSSGGRSSPRTCPSRCRWRGERELTPAGFVRPYLQRHKVRGVFAADDPLPALGVLLVRPLEDR